MKTNKYIFSVLGFLTGMVLGISTIGLLAFSNGPSASAPSGGMIPISSAVAHSYFNNYLSTATPFNQVIQGFTIDKAQLDAMNSIARENAALTGFRIYMGKDGSSKKIGIVVGIDNTGRDAVTNSIYNTEALIFSPCPPICDVSSPITLDK